jgi:hypothetical protein
MKCIFAIISIFQTAATVLGQDANYTLREDPLGYDSALEIEHIYNGQWPTGIKSTPLVVGTPL